MTDENDTDERIKNVLWNRDKIVLTAGEIADEVGVHRTTALDHLRELEAEGEVESIEVGAKGLGWYLPDDLKRAIGEAFLIPTYHEYVRRPVDGRGRATVGSEYAGKVVTLAILDSPAVQSVDADEWEYKTPLKWQRTAAIMDEEADERGRVHLGRDWAGKEVSIAVLEVNDG